MDMFGIKRGKCMKDPTCVRYQPRQGLVKTEGALGGLGITKCASCGLDCIVHEDLGRWTEGEPQLVDETGRKFKWVMAIPPGGGVAKSQRVEIP